MSWSKVVSSRRMTLVADLAATLLHFDAASWAVTGRMREMRRKRREIVD